MLFPFVGIQVARFFELSWAIFARVWPLVCVLSFVLDVGRHVREAFATVFANYGSAAFAAAQVFDRTWLFVLVLFPIFNWSTMRFVLQDLVV